MFELRVKYLLHLPMRTGVKLAKVLVETPNINFHRYTLSRFENEKVGRTFRRAERNQAQHPRYAFISS